MMGLSFGSNGSKMRISGCPTLNTKLAAEAAERALIERALRVEPLRKEVPTFKDFTETFMASYVEANNKLSERICKERAFRSFLLPALGKKRLNEITVADIESLKATLLRRSHGRVLAPAGTRKLSKKTINNVLDVLGKTLRFAHELEIIASVPKIRQLRVDPATTPFLDFDEFEALVRAANDPPYLRAAILLAGEAGLRIGEVRALMWEDIDLVAARLT
jgi:integrase